MGSRHLWLFLSLLGALILSSTGANADADDSLAHVGRPAGSSTTIHAEGSSLAGGLAFNTEPGPTDRAHPHAIILFIGDGMGEAQRTAARWATVGLSGTLVMDGMPFQGWARTASANNPVTDSAAAATALATGTKTDNGIIGMDPDLNPLTSILERAQAQGMAVGLVTNTQLAHATPAAFAAHVSRRSMMTEIARQMLAAQVDVLLGGGEDEFLPTTATGCYPEPGERTDGRHLIDEAVAAGYTYVCDATALASVVPTSTMRLLGLFADEGMPRPFSPPLAEMTQKAIAILSQDPDGFFLMVEGGQIDWAGHANDAANAISDTIGLDEAITVAQTYASTAEPTLIIVTADHETGGMSVDLTSSGASDQDGPFFMPDGTPFYVNWTTTGHTAVDVPTSAQGSWSDLLVGTYENTYIHDVMRTALESSPQITLTQTTVPPPGSAVMPGDGITYTFILTNDGDADAVGLVLTDTLPTGVSYVPGSADATLGLRIVTTPPLALVLTGTLPAGDVLTATFRVTVSAVPSGTVLINGIEATATGYGTMTSTASHPVFVTPNLLITKTATPVSGSAVTQGDWITYTVAVFNSGGPVRGMVLSDTLDLANLTLVVSHTNRGLLSGPDPVRVTGIDLGPGQGVTLTLGVTVTGDVGGTVISNRASLTSTETSSSQFSNRVTHVVGHKGTLIPSFVLIKSANPPSGTLLARGDVIDYQIIAINGGDLATNIALTDPIPMGTTYAASSATANLGNIGFDSEQVRVDVPSLPSGGVLTATFRVTVTTHSTFTISNTALLFNHQTVPHTSNSVVHPVRRQEPHYAYLPMLLKGIGDPASVSDR